MLDLLRHKGGFANLIVGIIIAIVAVAGISYYGLLHYAAPRLLQDAAPKVETLAADYINGSLKIGSIAYKGGFTAAAKDITIYDLSQKVMVQVPEMDVTVSPLQGIMNTDKAVSEITLLNPTIYLTRDKQDKWNFQNFLKPSQSQKTPFYGKVNVEKGNLIVETPEGKWQYGVDGKVDAATNPDFTMAATVSGYGDTVKVDGVLNKATEGHMHVVTSHVALAPYAVWAEKYGKVGDLTGALTDVDLNWENDGKDVALSGTGRLDTLAGTYVVEGRRVPVTAHGDVKFEKGYVAINQFLASLDGQKVTVNGHLDFNDQDKMQGYALAETPEFTWDGITVQNFKLPVDVIDGKVTVGQAGFDYGNGKVVLNGSYDPKTGAVVALADVKNVTIAQGNLAKNPATINGSFGGEGTAKDDKFKLNILANAASIKMQDLVLQILDFDVDVDKDGYTINNFSARSGDMGNLALTGKGTYKGAFEAQGRMSDFPIGPVLALAGYEGSGLASGDFKASGTKDDINFHGMTQVQDLQYASLHVDEAHGLVDMQDNILRVHDYQVHMGQGTNVVNGTVDLRGDTPILDVTATTKQVRAEELVAISGKDIKLTGNVDNEVHLVGTIDHPNVTGNVTLTDGSAYGYLLDKVTGHYIYNDGAITLDHCVVNALATTVTLQGTMDRDQNLNFSALAENVDLARLPLKEEQVALTGYVSAKGNLTGTLTQPVFSGEVNSQKFTVNGQEIDALKGSLITNGRDINKLVATAEQKNPDAFSGLYAIDMNFNAPAKALQGTMNVSYGKLQSMLKMAKINYDVDGDVTGSVDMNTAGIGTGGEFHGVIENLRIHKLTYHQLLIDGHVKNKVVHFDSAHLQETEGQEDKGFIAMAGEMDFGKRTLNLELGGKDANPAIITAVMKDPVNITGTMNMAMQLQGSFDNPSGNASVEIDNGTMANVSTDKAVAMLSLKNDNLKLEQIFLTHNEYKLSAYGNMPVDLFRSRESRRDPNAQMNIQVNMEDAGLGILSAIKGVDWAVGPTNGKIVVSGTLEEPMLNGNLSVTDGAVKLKDVTTLVDKLNVDVQFAGNKVIINNVSATLGKGTVSGNGTYALRSSADAAYKFNMQAKNAEIISNIFRGRINGDVTIAPHTYVINRRALGSEQTALGYRPFIKANIRVDDALINMPTIPEFGESDSNMGLDVGVTLGPKVHLFNRYLYNMWLTGAMHIGGSTRYKIPSGRIEAKNGTITYLRNVFKLEKAVAHWTERGTILPDVDIEATTKFNMYRILMKISGPLSHNMDAELTSDPALSKSAIMRMLTFGRVASNNSDELTSSDLQNVLTAGLETAVLGDVEQFIKQTFGIDQFRIYMGRLNSGVDIDASRTRDLTPEERSQYNFLVGKSITDRLSVGYTASFNGQYNNVYTQYAISDHINFTAAKDQDSKKKYSLEYRISF